MAVCALVAERLRMASVRVAAVVARPGSKTADKGA